MSKLLIDTNIIIDLLAKRTEFYDEAAELFSRSDKKELSLAISSLTFVNTNYVLSKLIPPDESRAILQKFKVLVDILSLDDKIITIALSDNDFSDFENGLQYYTAIENQIDIIITRNKKDFKCSRLPVMTAREYLSKEYPA